ncbi:hypothetical protein Ancab_010716 [Ancistrocladus abbreviatus]
MVKEESGVRDSEEGSVEFDNPNTLQGGSKETEAEDTRRLSAAAAAAAAATFAPPAAIPKNCCCHSFDHVDQALKNSSFDLASFRKRHGVVLPQGKTGEEEILSN